MKKIILFAVICLVFAGCSKEDQNLEKSGTHFEAGQEVTLSFSVVGSKVISEDDGNNINFKWETGDKIKVSVGGASSEFELQGEGGGKSATFSGVMPAAGSKFDVQYPVDTPDYSTQSYSSKEALPHDKVLLIANDCELNKAVELKASTPIIGINLFGENTIVKSIQININSHTYTLNCGDGVELKATIADAKPFFIAVPEPVGVSYTFSVVIDKSMTASASVLNYKFTDAYEKSNSVPGIPVTKQTISTKKSITLSFDSIVNMAAKNVKVIIWAPVNCGTNNVSPYGRYYQFGRYTSCKRQPDAGNEVNAENYWTGSNKTNTTPTAGVFYYSDYGERKDWYTSQVASALPKWPQETSDTGYNSSYLANPCPGGWRIPTSSELEDLLGGCKWPTKVSKSQYGFSVDGAYFNGTNDPSSSTDGKVFLLFGSYISNEGSSKTKLNTGESMNYWASDVPNTSNAYAMQHVIKGASSNPSGVGAKVSDFYRAYGFTIRCVQK